ncbi:MAG TPA: PKD domain-containing protein, partial [Flavobacteriales bacterium]|nr:PKD domain-containing protein [Flavobacteriales bacterium]
PSNPLLAGVTYTLSLWISAAVSVGNHMQTQVQADPSYFVDQLPLAIFGHANECVSFPIDGVSDCIGFEPGWDELGRVLVQPSWDWTRVSITFTPAQEMHTIMIGGACDVPASFSGMTITNAEGDTYSGSPFFIIDELLLTIAQDQLLSPVVTEGSLCGEDARVVATPPQGATNYQWYRDGIAVVGQTGLNLNVSQLALGSGVYTMASTFSGECLMGSSYVPPPLEPTPQASFEPMEGCAPLTVQLADTTKGSNTVQWQLGDGTTAVDSALVHTYTVPGSYDVELTVLNSAGCTGTRLFEDAVIVHPPVSGQIGVDPDPAEIADPVVNL